MWTAAFFLSSFLYLGITKLLEDDLLIRWQHFLHTWVLQSTNLWQIHTGPALTLPVRSLRNLWLGKVPPRHDDCCPFHWAASFTSRLLVRYACIFDRGLLGKMYYITTLSCFGVPLFSYPIYCWNMLCFMVDFLLKNNNILLNSTVSCCFELFLLLIVKRKVGKIIFIL